AHAGPASETLTGYGRDAEPSAPLLPKSNADQWRQERPICRLYGRRRAGPGILRSCRIAAVGGREAVYAGRQFLHGWVWRLVLQPFLGGMRLRAGLSQRRQEPGQDADRGRQR